MTIPPLTDTISRFHSDSWAWGYATESPKPLMVAIGDNNSFWVVNAEDALRLEEAGYELAQ